MPLPPGDTTTTGNLGLTEIGLGTNNWGTVMNNNLQVIDTAVSDLEDSGHGPFTFNQLTPASTWVIVHNLGTFPSVTVVDSSGNWVVGGVHYDSPDQVTLTFSGGFSGTAVLG